MSANDGLPKPSKMAKKSAAYSQPMKITGLSHQRRNGFARIAARVVWEDTERPEHDVFFEVPEEFADALPPENPHPFVVGAIQPAQWHGEKRLALEYPVAPELRDGLVTATHWTHYWYRPNESTPVAIEAPVASAPPHPPRHRAGQFFSGGIDSLATLRRNRLGYPENHPMALRDGIIIYGQNIESDNRRETFDAAVQSLSEVARESGLSVIPIHTNLRLLDPDPFFYMKAFHGAILGAVAHAVSNRLDTVFIGGTDDIPSLALKGDLVCRPWGSHPLLDPLYGSLDLRLQHDALHLSRFEKTRLLADWDTALRHIKVCGPNYPGENCGVCEKCIRTELALLALGVLDKCDAFPLNEVTPDHLAEFKLRPDTRLHWTPQHQYLELIPPLEAIHRHDLVQAIRQMLRRSRPPRESLRVKAWKLDQKYLNGRLAKWKNALKR